MPASLLARTRILKRINAALDRGDVYVSAPAGYGKSTLLRLLLGHRPAITLLALTPSDADLSQLQARLQPHLTQARTVVLDDVHHLADATDVLAWLNEQRRTGTVRWVIGGRSIPHELQDTKRVSETLLADDLAFGLNEAKALLADRDDAFVAQWRELLQGWPLALALLARGRNDTDLDDAGELTTRDSLFSYLADSIFAHLPDYVAHAVRVSALPRRFDDSLLAQMLDRPLEEAMGLRQDIQHRALFLEATEPAGWFRYHDTVREFLIAQLDGPTRETLIKPLIARFEADGEPHLAIESALDAGLFDRAARLLNTHKRTILNSFGRFTSYERWLSRLPEEVHLAWPMLTSNFVNELSTVDVPLARMQTWLDRVETLVMSQRDPDIIAEVNRDLANAYLSLRQTDRALELLWRAVRLPITNRSLAARLHSTLGATLALRFELKTAGRMFDEAWRIADMDQSSEGDNVRFAVRHNRANLVDNIDGNFKRAADAIATNMALFPDQPGKLDGCYVGLCTTHEAMGDWDALEHDLTEIKRLVVAQEDASGTLQQDYTLSAKWEMFYWSAVYLGRGEFVAATRMIDGFCAAVHDAEAVTCGQWLRAWALRAQGEPIECIAFVDAESLSDDPAARYHKALVAEERAIAAALNGHDDWLTEALPAIAFHIQLRARHHLLRWRILFALDCHRRGSRQWRKHVAFALHALARDDYDALLIRREPDLAERFWALCVREGVALDQAIPALTTLGRSATLVAHIAEEDHPRTFGTNERESEFIREDSRLFADQFRAMQLRLIEALAAVGDESAIPVLAAMNFGEVSVRAALSRALDHLESLSPPPLAVMLLGEFSVRRGDVLIAPDDWGRPGVRQLLHYFCVHRGQRLSRERVLRDVWPAGNGVIAFRTALSRLGNVIEPHLRDRTPLRYFNIASDIDSDGETICFDPRRTLVQLDSDVFLGAITTAKQAKPLAEATLASLLAALGTWRTPLGEVRYADWAQEFIERLNTAYVDGCVLAAEALLVRGRPMDLAQAERLADAAARTAPWHEPAWLALMRVTARQGRRGDALRIYDRAVAALARELGAPPSTALLSLAQRLRDDVGV